MLVPDLLACVLLQVLVSGKFVHVGYSILMAVACKNYFHGFVTLLEFMSGGSIYDFLHKQKRVFKLPALLRVAIDVSKGMNYLHQNDIIHRDLKAANLLMDENEVSNLGSRHLL